MFILMVNIINIRYTCSRSKVILFSIKSPMGTIEPKYLFSEETLPYHTLKIMWWASEVIVKFICFEHNKSNGSEIIWCWVNKRWKMLKVFGTGMWEKIQNLKLWPASVTWEHWFVPIAKQRAQKYLWKKTVDINCQRI